MLGDIIKLINSLYARRLDRLRSLNDMAYDNNLCKPYLTTESKLTESEIKTIAEKWGPIIPHLPRGYNFFRATKVINGFSPDYLPASFYSPILENILNPIPNKTALSHKGITEMLYRGVVKFPETILRVYNGILFDQNFNPISREAAAQTLKNQKGRILYKPALDTCQGKGIYILNTDQVENLALSITREDQILKIDDFVIQKFVPQSLTTQKFNPTSLNCFRITTLNLNGVISVCTIALKCGPVNSVVDNIGTGKRGVAVGVHPDGNLYPYGFYGNGDKAYSHNGVEFNGTYIPGFDKVLATAVNLHKINPVCKLIGWDIALDDKNEPVLIEGNTVCPSLSFEQMATGPVFGNRTDEVIEYIKSNKTK